MKSIKKNLKNGKGTVIQRQKNEHKAKKIFFFIRCGHKVGEALFFLPLFGGNFSNFS